MEKKGTIEKFEKGLEQEEKNLKKELAAEEKGLAWFFRSHTFKILIAIIFVAVLIGSSIYLTAIQGRIAIENSQISAPVITLSSMTGGVLDAVYVREGDIVPEGTIVAIVSGEPIETKTSGIITFVQNTPGQIVSSVTPIVKMIDKQELRVIGHIDENKGLTSIEVGQRVMFTVDAFGSKEYKGVVDAISSTSKESDIVFSISDKREEQKFDINVRYDTSVYPELKNGMSARMWVYTT